MNYQHTGLTKTVSELQPLTRGEQTPALYANMERHPTEKVGSQEFAVNQERQNLQRLSVMYGSHMAQRTVLDRTIFSKAQRLYGRSNHFGLRTDMGAFEEMNVEDTLNDAYEQAAFDRELGHSKLQKIYGL